jgi:16S rRNA (guanine(966)-N(2))-methyltransferase RsmD
MVREALFSILGHAVPGRPFYDLFAGTGAVGLEALSRGASPVILIERDFRVAGEIERHLRAFHVSDQASVIRADVYRWAERWPGAAEPVNMFLGPPYPDFEHRFDALQLLINDLQQKMAPGSVLVIQSERTPANGVAHVAQWQGSASGWDVRRYGRNQLSIWVKEASAHVSPSDAEQP